MEIAHTDSLGGAYCEMESAPTTILPVLAPGKAQTGNADAPVRGRYGCCSWWRQATWWQRVLVVIAPLAVAQALGWGIPAAMRQQRRGRADGNSPGVGSACVNAAPTTRQFAFPRSTVFGGGRRPRRLLEPPDGVALHGGGQSTDNFANYSRALGASAPLLFMTYTGLDWLNDTASAAWFFSTLSQQLFCYGDAFLVPQIGLSLTTDDGSGGGHPFDAAVAAGLYDYGISQLVRGLEGLGGRPVFLRVSYEYNGGWNGYRPATFVASWVRIFNAVQASPVLRTSVAFVLDYSCDQPDVPPDAYEPPNGTVHWYGVNVFSGSAAPDNAACVRPFLEKARARGYPVIFAESTPRGTGAGPGSWSAWFRPYFSLLSSFNDTAKAFCYINTNWATTPWPSWGDSRVEMPGAVGPTLAAQLAGPAFFNVAGAADVRRILGL